MYSFITCILPYICLYAAVCCTRMYSNVTRMYSNVTRMYQYITHIYLCSVLVIFQSRELYCQIFESFVAETIVLFDFPPRISLLSIYTLSDLDVSSNLIGSLSLANEHYSPPTE